MSGRPRLKQSTTANASSGPPRNTPLKRLKPPQNSTQPAAASLRDAPVIEYSHRLDDPSDLVPEGYVSRQAASTLSALRRPAI